MNDNNEQTNETLTASDAVEQAKPNVSVIKTIPVVKKSEKSDQTNDDRSRRGRKDNIIDKFFSNLSSKMPLPELLKKQLEGVILCEIIGHDTDYVIDLRTDKFVVLKRSEIEDELKYDCTIRLKRYDLEELISGELNPQIAMLSHKIQITGSMNMGMYFFNLFE